MTGYIKKVFGRKNVKKPLGPRVFQGKLKGFAEPGKPSMVGRGGSISAIFTKSAKPINSSI